MLLDLLLEHHDALPLLGRQHGDLLVRQLQDLEHIFIVRFPVLIMTETMIRIRLRLVEISRQASM